MPEIVVVGSSNVDFVMKVDQLPERGETVSGGAFLQAFGGKGANQAVAAARAGGFVRFLSGVGDDHLGETMRQNFAHEGIDVSGVLSMPGTTSGTALIVVDHRGENYIAVSPGANHHLEPRHIRELREHFLGADQVVLQLEIPLDTVESALQLAQEAGVPTLLNFAPARSSEFVIDDRVTTLVVNEVECEVLSGMPVKSLGQALVAAESLRDRGPRWVVVTLGSDGVLAATPEGVLRLPAFDVVPVDTTAAGDTFCGALAVALSERFDTESALMFACAAAAISVTRVGAQPSIPTREEIDRFLA